jgi:predicted membrane protein
MSLYNDISPRTLMIIGIIIAIFFVLMLLRIFWDFIVLRKGRKEQEARVKKLLLSNMVGRLNIPLEKYFEETSDIDKERHIWACQRCPKPEECERMFLGEKIDPGTFCPNYKELENIKDS